MAMRMSLMAVVIGLMAGGSVLAAEGDDKPRERGPRDPERMQKLLEKFDADGDGKLNKEERTAAREARMAKRGEKGGEKAGEQARKRGGPRGPRGPQRMPDPAALFDKIDADGDGSINKDQFIAFMQKMREERMSQRGPRGEGRRGGPKRDKDAAPAEAELN